MKKLTGQQEQFCQQYVVDLNACAAAKRAGYAKKTAEALSFRMLGNDRIRARIAELMEDRNKSTKIDAEFVLRRLAAEVEADIGDIFEENGGIKPLSQWPKIWRQGLVSGLDVAQQYTVSDGQRVPDGVVVKLKLSDRAGRLKLLGDHVDVQAFREQVKVDAAVTLEDFVLSKVPK